jgi:hypothetical protein
MQAHISKNFGKRAPIYFITLVVWFVTGAWHGASMNYIGWGLVNGIVIMLSLSCEPLYKRFHARFSNIGKRVWYRAFTVIRTFCLMRMISAFFLYEDVATSVRALLSVFTNFRIPNATALTELMPTEDWAVVGAGVALLVFVGVQKRGAFEKQKPIIRQTAVLLLLLIVLVFGLYGFGYEMDQFIYNRY